MPAKKKTERQTAKAAAFTISAPNPFYEGRFYDGKMRFIDGKARITDSLARTVKMRDGVSHGEYFFEDAEEMARHFMDTIGGNLDEQGQPTERTFKVTPALTQLAPVIDENTPNAGRSRRDRKRPGGVIRQMATLPEAQPAGIPAGADPAQVMGVGRKDRKKAVA